MLGLKRTFFSKIALFFILLPLFFILVSLVSLSPSIAIVIPCNDGTSEATCQAKNNPTQNPNRYYCASTTRCEERTWSCNHATALGICTLSDHNEAPVTLCPGGTCAAPADKCGLILGICAASATSICTASGNAEANAYCLDTKALPVCCIPTNPDPGPGPGPDPEPPPGTCFQCGDEFPTWEAKSQRCYTNVGGERKYDPDAPGRVTCVLPETCFAGCGCGLTENPCHKATSKQPGYLPCGAVGSNCNTAIGNVNASDFTSIVKGLFSAMLGIGGSIAVLLIIWSGYKLTTSRGDPERLQNAKEQLTAAIVGLLFIIFSLLILQVIGYDILGIPAFGP